MAVAQLIAQKTTMREDRGLAPAMEQSVDGVYG